MKKTRTKSIHQLQREVVELEKQIVQAKRSGKPSPRFQDAVWKAATISPPLNNKVTKGRGAGYSLGYVTPENIFEPTLDNPALSAGANIISATTNIPLDRVVRKTDNLVNMTQADLAAWERAALFFGWQDWELGINDNKVTTSKSNKNLRSKQDELAQSLQNKYGEGTINVDSGDFIKAE